MTAGLHAWPRHLPVSEATHRRAALLALALAQAPVVVGLLLLAPVAARQPPGLAALRLVALPPVVAAAAVAAWPGEHPARSRPLALLALLILAQPTLPAFLAALLLTVLADHLSGPLAAGTVSRRRGPATFLPTPALIAGRALGPSALLTVLPALLPLGAMAFFRVNNDLGPGPAAGAARLGGGLAVVFLLAGLTERLVQRRPAWPWARSLPVGSSHRTAGDATLLALAALLPIGATAVLDPVAAATVAAGLPWLAFRAAGAVHAGTRPRAGAATPFLGEGALLAGLVALLPWLALVALAAAPLAWRAAAERDRRQKVSRWDELHHRGVGDPVSWSAR